MAGGIGTRSIATRYPVVKGLVAGTTSQTGNKEWLEPETKHVFHGSCNINEESINNLLLESNDFILYEDGDFIELEG